MNDRRRLISLLASGFFFLSRRATANDDDVSDPGGRSPEPADKWLNTVLAGRPSRVVHLQRFADPVYVLLKEARWIPNPQLSQFPVVTVPKGFVAKLNLPQVFWSLLPPSAILIYPLLIHDYLYWAQTTTREVADRILRVALTDADVAPHVVVTLYGAVRYFGATAWKDNALRKAQGERRVIRVLPTDPSVRWSEYKLDPSIY